MKQRIIDLLAASRFANLPTVWSNILLGFLLGWAAKLHQPGIDQAFSLPPLADPAAWRGAHPLITLLALVLPASCLYLGGCFLNDWKDADFDRAHKPERPIPAGRFPRGLLLGLALLFLGGGLALSAALSNAAALLALGIVLCILAYTHWHKVSPWSFAFMAGARALLYPFALFALTPWPVFQRFLSFQKELPAPWLLPVLMLGLAAYILGISLFARHESRRLSGDFKPAPGLIALFILPLITGTALLAPASSVWQVLLAISPLAVTLFLLIHLFGKERDIGAFVSRALAAIPLVDATAALLLLYPFITKQMLAPTQAGVLYLAFFAFSLLALLLQRLAPAT
ncbi:MAG: UbiA family prenyltransferase [Verrucomicrobiales bacterium]